MNSNFSSSTSPFFSRFTNLSKYIAGGNPSNNIINNNNNNNNQQHRNQNNNSNDDVYKKTFANSISEPNTPIKNGRIRRDGNVNKIHPGSNSTSKLNDNGIRDSNKNNIKSRDTFIKENNYQQQQQEKRKRLIDDRSVYSGQIDALKSPPPSQNIPILRNKRNIPCPISTLTSQPSLHPTTPSSSTTINNQNNNNNYNTKNNNNNLNKLKRKSTEEIQFDQNNNAYRYTSSSTESEGHSQGEQNGRSSSQRVPSSRMSNIITPQTSPYIPRTRPYQHSSSSTDSTSEKKIQQLQSQERNIYNQAYAKLIPLNNEPTEGFTEHLICKKMYTIGARRINDLEIYCKSRKTYAVLKKVKNKLFTIEKLSNNPISINGMEIFHPFTLKDCDKIQIDDHSFIFQYLQGGIEYDDGDLTPSQMNDDVNNMEEEEGLTQQGVEQQDEDEHFNYYDDTSKSNELSEESTPIPSPRSTPSFSPLQHYHNNPFSQKPIAQKQNRSTNININQNNNQNNTTGNLNSETTTTTTNTTSTSTNCSSRVSTPQFNVGDSPMIPSPSPSPSPLSSPFMGLSRTPLKSQNGININNNNNKNNNSNNNSQSSESVNDLLDSLNDLRRNINTNIYKSMKKDVLGIESPQKHSNTTDQNVQNNNNNTDKNGNGRQLSLRMGLFQGISFYLSPFLEDSDALHSLIKVKGGVIIEEFGKTQTDTYYIVPDVVQFQGSLPKLYRKFFKFIKESWVLDSIMANECIDVSSYTFRPKKLKGCLSKFCIFPERNDDVEYNKKHDLYKDELCFHGMQFVEFSNIKIIKPNFVLGLEELQPEDIERNGLSTFDVAKLSWFTHCMKQSKLVTPSTDDNFLYHRKQQIKKITK